VTLERPVRPELVGVSSRSLAALDAHVAGYVERGSLPGALVLVARKGEVVHLSTFGRADCERNVPVAADTIFRIYSMTKPMTSIALMQLYERGLVELDAPVHEYIPAWRNLPVFSAGAYPDFETRPPARPMTVRDLLSHQSGLAYGLFEDTPVERGYRAVQPMDRTGTLDDMAAKLATLPLKFSPGERWNYSVSTDVVGYLVQLISGQPFDEYLADHVIEPLGMTDTAFWVSPDRVDRFASSYRATASGGFELADDPRLSAFLARPTLPSGGGGLVSTAGDYWRFAQALANGGTFDGERIIGRKTLAFMTSNHIAHGRDLAEVGYGIWSGPRYRGIGFGLGVAVTMDPVAAQVSGSPGDFFWGGMASTAFFVDPAESLVVVFMTQLIPSTTSNIRRELRAIVYGALT
jgi:CubicO group peptidase (beta-lactamase class C family)